MAKGGRFLKKQMAKKKAILCQLFEKNYQKVDIFWKKCSKLREKSQFFDQKNATLWPKKKASFWPKKGSFWPKIGPILEGIFLMSIFSCFFSSTFHFFLKNSAKTGTKSERDNLMGFWGYPQNPIN